MIRLRYAAFILSASLVVTSCSKRTGGDDDESDGAAIHAKVPVTIVHPVVGNIDEPLVLNAIATYQRKNIVAAPVQGYIISVSVNPGDRVATGQELFVLQTKESHALAGSSALRDSLRGYTGRLAITASASGIVTSVLRQAGDYVQDGDQLCAIADAGSFAFVLNVPYADTRYLHPGEVCMLSLPDSTHAAARIGKVLSAVDPVSQTQQYLLQCRMPHVVPENVIASVTVIKQIVPHATALPRTAVLADEAMSSFWIMRIANDSTAVRVPVTKGVETDSLVQILSPQLLPSDRVVLSGNYGLDDTASVKIISSAP